MNLQCKTNECSGSVPKKGHLGLCLKCFARRREEHKRNSLHKEPKPWRRAKLAWTGLPNIIQCRHPEKIVRLVDQWIGENL